MPEAKYNIVSREDGVRIEWDDVKSQLNVQGDGHCEIKNIFGALAMSGNVQLKTDFIQNGAVVSGNCELDAESIGMHAWSMNNASIRVADWVYSAKSSDASLFKTKSATDIDARDDSTIEAEEVSDKAVSMDKSYVKVGKCRIAVSIGESLLEAGEIRREADCFDKSKLFAEEINGDVNVLMNGTVDVGIVHGDVGGLGDGTIRADYIGGNILAGSATGGSENVTVEVGERKLDEDDTEESIKP